MTLIVRVQYCYSFYLKHFIPNTKDIIKESTNGVQFEWFIHNVVYYGSKLLVSLGLMDESDSIIESAASADIGGTIFADSGHGIKGDIMKIAYLLFGSPYTVIWDLIISGGYN